LRPERTLFVILERWNIGFAEQASMQQAPSFSFSCDTSTLGYEKVNGLGMPDGISGLNFSREQMGLNGRACLFRTFARPWTQDVTVMNETHLAWSASFRFETMEVGWWVLILAFGLLPSLRLWSRYYLRTIRIDHCTNCGYDLRASPDRCPECGIIHSVTADA